MIQKDGVDIEMLPDDWKRTGHVIQACDFFAEKVFSCDTKNESDWNKQYAPGQGIWYRSNQDVFYKYGIGKEQIVWVNYFKDSMDEMKEKILNSSILMLTGGAPDLMMKRIKEKKLKKLIKNYKGIMIGYSAGAMIQLDSYHIMSIAKLFEYES